MPDTFYTVPELRLSDYTTGTRDMRRQFVDELWHGFKHFGFVILTEHNVPIDVLNDAYDLAREFFDLPLEEKCALISGVGGQRGYTPFGIEHAKTSSVPDLKEFWHVGRDFPPGTPLSDTYPPNLWPDRPAGFRDAFLALFDGLEESGQVMLEALTPKFDVPETFFREMTTDGNSILRLLHYPPVPEGADPRAVRAAAHEDINLITILVAANGAGLELLDRNGDWLAINTAPENLIVDAGDMLARLSNDVIPATTHRVVNPDGPNLSRYSMPFFMHPHPSVTLTCLESCIGDGAKYPDISAEAFLEQRLKEIGLTS